MSKELNKEHIREWVWALRSGKYEQGHDALVTETSSKKRYCCLGVACVIAGLQEGSDGNFLGYENDGIFERNAITLPRKAQDWLGVDSDVPQVLNSHNEMQDLTALNDCGVPFSEIANLIEKNWLS